MRSLPRAFRRAVRPRTFAGQASLSILLATLAARADSPPVATNSPSQLPEVVVTGQKLAAPESSLPVSDSAVTRSTLRDADIQSIKDASFYAPNTYLSEFSSRADSTPYFRGIGGNYANPAVTTFIDGVPQLNAYSSSIELLDVNQVEFVRGPQGGLFGRNTSGGLINITSQPPSNIWTGWADAGYGNYDYRDFRGGVSGPASDGFSLGLAAGYSARDGYLTSSFDGRGINSREADFGKAQLLYKLGDHAEFRLILSGEHDGDGDYAIGDLAFIRANPDVVDRTSPDYGFNHRDVTSATLLGNYYGTAVDLASISSVGWWRNDGLTDWDYNPVNAYAWTNGLSAQYENNVEQEYQLFQEFRASSAKGRPISLGDSLNLSWQSGVSVFNQSYEQNDSIFGGSHLYNWGVGVYGQAKLTAWEKLDFTAGLRYDYEHEDGSLTPAYGPITSPAQESSQASPQFSIGYRPATNNLVYVSVARGFRAGGFNSGVTGSEDSYGSERTWNYEVGYKSKWFDGKLEAGLALYYINWNAIQLTLIDPNNFNYYTANVGEADSKGVEFAVKYRPVAGWDLFGSVGYTDAHFLSGSTDSGVSVAGNPLPNTPVFTGNMGTQFSWPVCHYASLYARAEVNVYGDFEYDPYNVEGQSTFALANFRAGVRGNHWYAEGWVNNAFDTHYVPIAFGYPGITASGYAGEAGAPLTFGLRAGIKF